jgi:hypothetical protein
MKLHKKKVSFRIKQAPAGGPAVIWLLASGFEYPDSGFQDQASRNQYPLSFEFD